MPRYSARAAGALALLKRAYNDVDIFVEDTGNHNMWLLLVRKFLLPGTHISSVNMLGGRDAVEAACKLDQTNTGRRKLYITDGDMDWLLGKNKLRLRYLYRLRSYSIEGLLVSEASLLHLALESCPTKTEAQILAAMDYAQLARELEIFKGLFVSYAVAFQLFRRVQTVGYPVGHLFLSSPIGPAICRIKTFRRASVVYRKVVEEVGLIATAALRHAVLAQASELSLAQSVSGKDYLLPFVMKRFKASCMYRGSPEQFKVALARHIDVSMEPYLARRLRNLSP